MSTQIKHGHATRKIGRTAEYDAWVSMRGRCLNPKDKSYSDYGGRGISVCDRWRYSFESFLADVGYRPSANHSLDRFPDNNGPYSPENCRWATRIQQMNNTRACKSVLHAGQTLSFSRWAAKLGISKSTLIGRLTKYGWSVDRALTQKVDSRKDWRKRT